MKTGCLLTPPVLQKNVLGLGQLQARYILHQTAGVHTLILHSACRSLLAAGVLCFPIICALMGTSSPMT